MITQFHAECLPALTQDQAKSLIAQIISHLPGFQHLDIGETVEAAVRLDTGRTIVLRPEAVTSEEALGLVMSIDRVHRDDLDEVHRLRSTIVTAFPECARLLAEELRGTALA